MVATVSGQPRPPGGPQGLPNRAARRDPVGWPRLRPVSRDRPTALLNGPAVTQLAQQAPSG